MKSKLVLFYSFISIVLCEDFDLSMNIYSDVFDNYVSFTVTANPDKGPMLEYQPISLNFLLEDEFLSFAEDRSYTRIPVRYKDSTHLEGVWEFAGEIVKFPSKLKRDPFSDRSFSMYGYMFNTRHDSLHFKSNNFESEKRNFQIQFFSLKNNITISDSVKLKINFYSPILDSIDIRYYEQYRNKDKFKKLSQNKIKRNGDPNEPLFSIFVKLPSKPLNELSGPAGIEISYKNSNNKTLLGIISNNEKKAKMISEKQNDIPIIILATIVGIMVIFIMILIGKEAIKAKHRRTVI